MNQRMNQRMNQSQSDRKSIAAWRLLRGDMTQQELATRAGLHLSTVAVTESGATRPSSDTLRAIADALGVGMDQIELPPRRRKDNRRGKGAGDKRTRRGLKPRKTTPPGNSGDDDAGDPSNSSDASDAGDDPKIWARTAA